MLCTYKIDLRGEGGHHTGLISQVHRQFESVPRIQFRTLAQLVERLPYTQNVVGSNPAGPTTLPFKGKYDSKFKSRHTN